MQQEWIKEGQLWKYLRVNLEEAEGVEDIDRDSMKILRRICGRWGLRDTDERQSTGKNEL